MKHLKEYKIFESTTDEKRQFIIVCMRSYSEKQEETGYNVIDIDENIIATADGFFNTFILELVTVNYGNNHQDYFIKYMNGDTFDKFYTKIIGLNYETIDKIYDYLVKKYPEAKEGDDMGFFDLKTNETKHIKLYENFFDDTKKLYKNLSYK